MNFADFLLGRRPADLVVPDEDQKALDALERDYAKAIEKGEASLKVASDAIHATGRQFKQLQHIERLARGRR